MISRLGRYSFAVLALIVFLTGCEPTYPKERLKESIIRLCKNEYNLDVKVRTFGKTVAIYMLLDDLMDLSFALTPSATEKLNDVIMSVTRAVLSTDADYDFYCIIAHDVRVPEIQIIIIKYVKDVKRVFLGDISRGEFGKRMIVDLRLNPQSQKERSIKDVFLRMGLDPKWQDQVMNDFFRAEPAGLGDIGYWGGSFYIKDITLPEFLAEQIASRIKMEFRADKALSAVFSLKSVKGYYNIAAGSSYFKVDLLAEGQSYGEADPGRLYDGAIKAALKVAADVIHGYAFDGFDYIEIINQADKRDLKVSRDSLEKYRTKKIKFEEMVN
ncbi:MAG: hypothetical protein KJ994_03585 [Candidatus Omnitrophica bacterium]|nr:hypothetical protein [Candidatus Omnitrophota bacterium]MBU0894978.1 hypothetical protein [Candidatus Omnitrophota bacterium]MBU1038111.1 hypothetical protein [Candidatus Omnitrophota bacterium]MBU1808225.1 hypothetical protein [Candidatus Omnitrophota bacterium]